MYIEWQSNSQRCMAYRLQLLFIFKITKQANMRLNQSFHTCTCNFIHVCTVILSLKGDSNHNWWYPKHLLMMRSPYVNPSLVKWLSASLETWFCCIPRYLISNTCNDPELLANPFTNSLNPFSPRLLSPCRWRNE